MPSHNLLPLLLAVATATAADCPSPDWQRYRSKCYWRSNYTLNGRSVARVCDAMSPGSKPVSIHDLDLDAFIGEDLMQGERGQMGLHRAYTDEPWTWADGSDMNYTMWYQGEPDRPTGEACGSINWGQMGFWSDESCDTFYTYFMCQTDA